jgi:glycosyltransferase involved in cell wall biosynthesis
MQRYASLLLDGFTRAGHQVEIVRPLVNIARLAWSSSSLKWFGYVDKFVLFPSKLPDALATADIVHVCDHSNAIYTKYLRNKPYIVTCHDLLAVRSAMGELPDHRTRWSGRLLQRMILKGLSRARAIACVSDATRAQTVRLIPGAGREVTRIYNGMNYAYEPMNREQAAGRLRKLGIPANREFVLHVGGNQWYKNRLGVLQVFARLRARTTVENLSLIMVGKPWTEQMRQFARSQKIEESALELVGVAEEDLRALYSSAEVLLFPSLEEGFGWPIAEAQACGCPVVTTNRAPMTEVGGTAAIYIDPCDHESSADAVASAIGSRAALHGQNIQNAARFKATTMIENYLDLYCRVIERHTRSRATLTSQAEGYTLPGSTAL